jgi:flagellar motor switch protein FliM
MSDTPATEEGATRAAISDEEVAALLEKSPESVRPYDFAAHKVSRTQLPMLELIAKSFAEHASVSLAALLGRDTVLQFTSVESVKTADFQASLSTPACVAVVRIKPLPETAFVTIEPQLLLTLLDGFFGGSGRAIIDNQAIATSAAQRFMTLLMRSLMANWVTAWVPVAAIEVDPINQETNPRLVQFGDAKELLVAVQFAVEVGTQTGQLAWLLPEKLLAPVREALASISGKVADQRQDSWTPALTATLQTASIETRALMAQAQISLGELVRLSVGDIIPIDAPQQVTLLAGDIPLYRGRFGVSQGRNALRIDVGDMT